jgi:hypothetical protein
MLIDEIRNIKSTRRELRKFGLTMAVALAVIGGFVMWRQKSYYRVLFVASALFLLPGLLLPALLKPFQKVWMTLALLIGWVMTHLILTILFYLVLTPTALIMRVLGKDILNLRFEKDSAKSYWIPRPTDGRQKSDYEKQF